MMSSPKRTSACQTAWFTSCDPLELSLLFSAVLFIYEIISFMVI